MDAARCLPDRDGAGLGEVAGPDHAGRDHGGGGHGPGADSGPVGDSMNDAAGEGRIRFSADDVRDVVLAAMAGRRAIGVNSRVPHQPAPPRPG